MNKKENAKAKAAASLDNITTCGQNWMNLVQECEKAIKIESAQFAVRKTAFEAMHAKLKDTTKFGLWIKLNVGGQFFMTLLETLRTREPQSFLAAMFSGEWKSDTDDQGAFFIDRDGTHFRVLLNYLRTGELVWPSDEAHRRELELELEFFQFENHAPPPLPPFPDSTLLTPDQQAQLIAWRRQSRGLTDTRAPSPKWQLLYRMSRDGRQFNSFTQRCANKGETFLVAKSVQGCFGGYGAKAWSLCQTQSDRQAFTFAFDHRDKSRMTMAPSATLYTSPHQLIFSNELQFAHGDMSQAAGILTTAMISVTSAVQEIEVWGTVN